jgi:alkylated DNA repair dioxygenase AlkB
MKQGELFAGVQRLPSGFVYQPDFITEDEKSRLLAEISHLPLHEAKYKEYTAKRRIMSYGGTYDYSGNELIPAGPLPPFLHELRDRISDWTQIRAGQFTHALIAEYQTGTQLGWHRDVPEFEVIVGVSLLGTCRMRLRRYPPKKGRDPESLSVNLEPRSAYTMRGQARWGWQHSIPPTKTTRYSITFRTQRSAKT